MTEAPSALRATELRTEYSNEPLGVDEPAPLLSWKLSGSGRGRSVSAYRVRVVIDEDPTVEGNSPVWDSGDVVGQAISVAYAGEPLRARTRYGWAIRLTDEAGRPGPWSEPAYFETGLFDPSDWTARWITASDESPGDPFWSLDPIGHAETVTRIWLPSAEPMGAVPNPPGSTACFRTGFTLPEAAVEHVRLLAVGARSVQAWINGIPIRTDGVASDDAVRTLSAELNVVAVRADADADEVPGLVAKMEISLVGESTVDLVSSGRWRVASEVDEGWRSEEYDDTAWSFAEEYGWHGEMPRAREPESHRPSPYLRREFELDREIRRARLYSTALGVYEARINGAVASADRFAPGWTDYSARVPYQTYDVTELVKRGTNTIGAVLADGWYAGNICWFGPFQYGNVRAFRAQLVVEYADGDTAVIETDGSWRSGHGAIRHADLQGGEVVDARLEPTGWDRNGFADEWPAVTVVQPDHGRLEAQVAPPIRVQETLTPREIRSRGDGRYLVDFGQNAVGWVRLRLAGPAGTRVMVRHSEVLDHRDELYLEALRTAVSTDEYVLAGDPGGEVFEPRFTVHGFRYAEIIGVPGELTEADVSARVVWAQMEATGEFECSNADLNQLQQNIVWSQRGNFLSVPTDCPQRDERLGWTGDAQVFAPTAAFNYDVRGFFRKWMRDLRDGQKADGGVPHVAPDVLTPNEFVLGPDGAAAGSAGWGDAMELVPHALLWAYGDARFTVEAYAGITAWLDYLQDRSDGLIRPDDGFADWLAPTSTPRDLVQTAYLAYAARIAAELARRLDRTDARDRWEDLYRRVRAAFRARYVGGGGHVASGSQTAYVLALAFGLLEPEEESRAAARLVEEIASRNWHLATGFLGTPFLLPVLTRTGHLDAAYRLLLQDSVPSWLYPVVRGDATTIWERWDSWSDSRGFQDPHMTSFNHYAYGAVGEWMYDTLGGLAAAEPGFSRVRVDPRPGGGIEWARTSRDTPYGPTAVHWRHDGAGFAVDVRLPPGVGAEVWLPSDDEARVTEGDAPLARADGVRNVEMRDGRLVVEIGSGDYRFAVAPVD